MVGTQLLWISSFISLCAVQKQWYLLLLFVYMTKMELKSLGNTMKPSGEASNEERHNYGDFVSRSSNLSPHAGVNNLTAVAACLPSNNLFTYAR